jgi:hypothetical protein
VPLSPHYLYIGKWIYYQNTIVSIEKTFSPDEFIHNFSLFSGSSHLPSVVKSNFGISVRDYVVRQDMA